MAGTGSVGRWGKTATNRDAENGIRVVGFGSGLTGSPESLAVIVLDNPSKVGDAALWLSTVIFDKLLSSSHPPLSGCSIPLLFASSYAAASCEVDFEQHNIFLPSKRYRGQYNKVGFN